MTKTERANYIARIIELESQLEDAYVVIDLKDADNDDLRAENRALKGQLQQLRIDRRYEVA